MAYSRCRSSALLAARTLSPLAWGQLNCIISAAPHLNRRIPYTGISTQWCPFYRILLRWSSTTDQSAEERKSCCTLPSCSSPKASLPRSRRRTVHIPSGSRSQRQSPGRAAFPFRSTQTSWHWWSSPLHGRDTRAECSPLLCRRSNRRLRVGCKTSTFFRTIARSLLFYLSSGPLLLVRATFLSFG